MGLGLLFVCSVLSLDCSFEDGLCTRWDTYIAEDLTYLEHLIDCHQESIEKISLLFHLYCWPQTQDSSIPPS